MQVLNGALGGTRTPTVARQNLNLVRLPVPPQALIFDILTW